MRRRGAVAVSALRGFALGCALVAVAWLASGRLAAPYAYDKAPPGFVYAAADLTFDGGATRQYRLIVIASDDGLPYTVRVNHGTYARFTETLGRGWP